MSDKEFLERMLSMLPEEFQDIYDDTIPEAKEVRKKMGKKTSSAPSYSCAMYGAQNEAYMSRSAEKWVRGLCFNELGVGG